MLEFIQRFDEFKLIFRFSFDKRRRVTANKPLSSLHTLMRIESANTTAGVDAASSSPVRFRTVLSATGHAETPHLL
jgi:hypothetical protein